VLGVWTGLLIAANPAASGGAGGWRTTRKRRAERTLFDLAEGLQQATWQEPVTELDDGGQREDHATSTSLPAPLQSSCTMLLLGCMGFMLSAVPPCVLSSTFPDALTCLPTPLPLPP